MTKFFSFVLISTLAFAPLITPIATANEPRTYVRRAEAIMILMKNAGIAIDPNAANHGNYPDMVDGFWYVPYMLKGIDMGLLRAHKRTGYVYPHRSVSRAEFLMMMTKAFALTTNIPYQYTDIPDHPAYSAYAGLSWRYRLLSSGAAHPTLLYPKRRITHKEAAYAIHTLLAAEPSLKQKRIDDASKQHLLQAAGARDGSLASLNVAVSTKPTSVKTRILNLIRSRGSLAEQTRNDLIHAVNIERARYKLAPLRSNYYLERTAQLYAKDMSDRGYFSHYTPEGLNYVDRIRGGGYLNIDVRKCSCAQQFDLSGNTKVQERGPDFIVTGKQDCSCEPLFSLGENLAKGQLSVDQVMRDWMKSPNHRKNILRPQFEEIGIGLFGDVWVQNFGRLEYK